MASCAVELARTKKDVDRVIVASARALAEGRRREATALYEKAHHGVRRMISGGRSCVLSGKIKASTAWKAVIPTLANFEKLEERIEG